MRCNTNTERQTNERISVLCLSKYAFLIFANAKHTDITDFLIFQRGQKGIIIRKEQIYANLILLILIVNENDFSRLKNIRDNLKGFPFRENNLI